MVGIGHTPNDVTIAAMNDVLSGNVDRVMGASHLHEEIMSEYTADKRLRDAAPDLLEAAITARSVLGRASADYEPESVQRGVIKATRSALSAAIAKATGQ